MFVLAPDPLAVPHSHSAPCSRVKLDIWRGVGYIINILLVVGSGKDLQKTTDAFKVNFETSGASTL